MPGYIGILEFEIDSCNFVLFLLNYDSRVVMRLTELSQSKNIYILPKTRREGEGRGNLVKDMDFGGQKLLKFTLISTLILQFCFVF